MRRLVISLLLPLSCALWHRAAAQDSGAYTVADTLGYRYTPLSQTDASLSSDADDSASRKPGGSRFAERFFNYFNRASVDRSLEKKIDFNIVGGPAYTNSTSLMLGIVAAGIYRTDRSDILSQPSNVMLVGRVSINGYYYIGIRGNTFFKRGRHRVDYELGFKSQPTDFWGLGYDAAVHNAAGRYTSKRFAVSASYRYEFVRHFYGGLVLDFNTTYAKNLTTPQYLDGQRHRYTAAGAGVIVEYDSRDVVTAPERGVYLSVSAIVRPKLLGDCGHTVGELRFTADLFRRLWRGGVLAADIHGEFNSQSTPWTMYAVMGGNYRMRGYYEGRFNDRNMVMAQLELRQRIWQSIGCAVWGGAGNIFGSISGFRWGHTLPNYGLGLRWEFKNRINARLDYGFGGKINDRLVHGLIISLNEAF